MIQSAKRRHLVLIVDDDPATCAILSSILEDKGYLTSSAGSVAEGIGALALQPTFLILDMHLPDGLGIEILQHIAKRRLPVHVTVATASDDGEFLRQIAEFKPDRILRKPYGMDDVLGWLAAREAA